MYSPNWKNAVPKMPSFRRPGCPNPPRAGARLPAGGLPPLAGGVPPSGQRALAGEAARDDGSDRPVSGGSGHGDRQPDPAGRNRLLTIIGQTGLPVPVPALSA